MAQKKKKMIVADKRWRIMKAPITSTHLTSSSSSKTEMQLLQPLQHGEVYAETKVNINDIY